MPRTSCRAWKRALTHWGRSTGDMALVAPLFEAFDGFVQQQAAFVPPDAARTRDA